MIRIGLVDYFFDNWHTNYYPGFLKEAAAKFGYDAAITGCYALHPSPTAISNEAWSRQQQIPLAGSLEELIQNSDALMVMGADNSAWKEELCALPLTSGKPTFVDKTFAPNLAVGKKFFALAKATGTPVYTSSAQRYCDSILRYQAAHPERPQFMSTVGPHDLSNYAVHQFEPIVALMGTGVQRVKAFAVGEKVTELILDYGHGRLASFLQTPNPYAEFNFMVSDGSQGQRLESADFYENAVHAMLEFFRTGVSAVPEEETLEVLALIDMAKRARLTPDVWLPMER